MTLSMFSRQRLCTAALALLACGAVGGAALAEAPTNSVRRLSQEQYRNIIADVFGPAVTVGGRFEPDIRRDGLLAVGASAVSVTASGLEQYDQIARNIAAQVVSPEHRDSLLPCKPAKENQADDACAKQFLSEAGRLLYRRPLTKDELASRVKVANESATKLKNFYTGLGNSLATMLVSPVFLFRQDVVERDPKNRGQYRLDSYSKASQLSFLLWNTSPDPELLDAAARGDLHTEAGTAKQVDRMLASPRLKAGVRAFFADMLGFDAFPTLAKDPMLFPKYSSIVARDAQEQTLRSVAEHLVTQKGDYRDLFTMRKTYLTPLLASVYGVPLPTTDGGWNAFEFAEGDPRAGLLAQVSFVALHSHPGRTSPTLRGKAVREALLCQKVPDPPGNVNFDLVQDIDNSKYKTARERLTAHATEAMCTGCHKITDPIGLALENFDSVGSFRTTENGVTIETAGEVDGKKFANAVELARAVHDHPAVTSCVVDRAYSYALGRPASKDEADSVEALKKAFAADGYKFTDLLRRIATGAAVRSETQVGSLEINTAPQTASTTSATEVHK